MSSNKKLPPDRPGCLHMFFSSKKVTVKLIPRTKNRSTNIHVLEAETIGFSLLQHVVFRHKYNGHNLMVSRPQSTALVLGTSLCAPRSNFKTNLYLKHKEWMSVTGWCNKARNIYVLSSIVIDSSTLSFALLLNLFNLSSGEKYTTNINDYSIPFREIFHLSQWKDPCTITHLLPSLNTLNPQRYTENLTLHYLGQRSMFSFPGDCQQQIRPL